MPRWRKMTWAIIIWCVLILIWAIAGGASNDCGDKARELNQSACEAGTGIGVALILFLGFIGFVFLSLIWLMTRPKGRVCPACGTNVKGGITACPSCGHNFAAAAAGIPQPARTAPQGAPPPPPGTSPPPPPLPPPPPST
jgi:putative copper export protein